MLSPLFQWGGKCINLYMKWWGKMKYYKSYSDSSGYIYSIDNVVIEYRLGIGNIESFIKSVQDLSEKYPYSKSEYWERLNCPLCSKYQYYETHIHLRDGIYVMIGKWILFDDKKDRSLFPMVKLDINPNKYSENDIFKELIDIIKPDIAEWYLKRFDFALDIKTIPDNIQNLYSRKEKGLFRGTRYYGIHNSNGFCKIYDKRKESNLDYDLTRIEHTIKLEDKRQKIDDIIKRMSLENIVIKSDNTSDIKLSNVVEAFKDLYLRCKSADIECDDILNKLNRKTKKDIITSLQGCEYKKIDYDYDIIKRLIQDIIDLFTDKCDIQENVNGFIEVLKDIDLPFD